MAFFHHLAEVILGNTENHLIIRQQFEVNTNKQTFLGLGWSYPGNFISRLFECAFMFKKIIE
jgi:hypothetical protein